MPQSYPGGLLEWPYPQSHICRGRLNCIATHTQTWPALPVGALQGGVLTPIHTEQENSEHAPGWAAESLSCQCDCAWEPLGRGRISSETLGWKQPGNTPRLSQSACSYHRCTHPTRPRDLSGFEAQYIRECHTNLWNTVTLVPEV